MYASLFTSHSVHGRFLFFILFYILLHKNAYDLIKFKTSPLTCYYIQLVHFATQRFWKITNEEQVTKLQLHPPCSHTQKCQRVCSPREIKNNQKWQWKVGPVKSELNMHNKYFTGYITRCKILCLCPCLPVIFTRKFTGNRQQLNKSFFPVLALIFKAFCLLFMESFFSSVPLWKERWCRKLIRDYILPSFLHRNGD